MCEKDPIAGRELWWIWLEFLGRQSHDLLLIPSLLRRVHDSTSRRLVEDKRGGKTFLLDVLKEH